MMKNSVTCQHCKSENPFYRTTCLNCKSHLRDRVYNLDLWKTIGLLIVNPSEAFKIIIFSEQKNFILFILIFASFKYLITTRFVAMSTLGEFQTSTGLIVSYLIVLACISGFMFLFAFLFTLIGKNFSLQTRFKDNLAILCYTQSTHVISLFILFPIELIVFGDYIFSLNPSPFVLKKNIAYLLSGIEIVFILWSTLISFYAFYTQSKNILIGLINMVIFNGFLAVLILILSILVFTV